MAESPEDLSARRRLVDKMIGAAAGAVYEIAPYDADDLVHCMAALGVDGYIGHDGEGEEDPPLLVHTLRSLRGLTQQIYGCFRHQHDPRAVRPETACVLLLHIVGVLGRAAGLDLETLRALAGQKLVERGEQSGDEVVRLARELRQDADDRRAKTLRDRLG